MKKALTNSLIFVSILLASCSSGEGKSEKFIGEWQSLESKERPHTIIEKRENNIIVYEGEKRKIHPATYDKENDKISLNIPMAGTIDIIYLADNDHIVISGGGEYSRVR